MPRITDHDLLALTTPGVVLTLDADAAADLGAFEEEALTAAEALASADIPPEYLPGHPEWTEEDA